MSTHPVAGQDYEPIPGDDKHVRCLRCNNSIPSPLNNSTRLKRHYSGLGAHNNPNGKGAKVIKCTKIDEDTKKAMQDADVTTDVYVAMPEGYTRFQYQRARPHLVHFAHDPDGRQVACGYCNARFAYDPTLMSEHLLAACSRIPSVVREDLNTRATKGPARVTLALRAVVQTMLASGLKKPDVYAWYFSPGTRALVLRLASLPAVPEYALPPMDELL